MQASTFLGVLIFFLIVAPICAAQNGQAQLNGSPSPQEPGPGRSWVASPKTIIPDAVPAKANMDPANAERAKQIVDDSTRLLKMATELKAEVDKTNKETLSLSVIRKADQIEKLAHTVKEKMKLTPVSH